MGGASSYVAYTGKLASTSHIAIGVCASVPTNRYPAVRGGASGTRPGAVQLEPRRVCRLSRSLRGLPLVTAHPA